MPILTESPAVSAENQLDIWFTRCPVPTAFGLAVQRGLLDHEFAHEPNLKIRALQQSSDPKVHQSHYTHTQPNSFRHGGNNPAIWAHSAGADTRVIGLSWIPGENAIFTLPDSPIRTVADLKGKRLLAVRRPAEDIDYAYATVLRTYEVALRSTGLDWHDVDLREYIVNRSYISDRIQHGSPGYLSFNKAKTGLNRWDETIFPLIRGEVDAVAAGGVVATQFEELLGLKSIFNTGSLSDRSERANNNNLFTFAVKARLIEEHPDFVARLYTRVLEAAAWAERHESDAIRFAAQEQAAPEKIARDTYGSLLPAGLKTDLAPDKIAALRSVKNFLLRHKIISRDFDIDQWIDPRPLKLALKLIRERDKEASVHSNNKKIAAL